MHKVIFFDWNKTLSNSRFWEQLDNPSHRLYKKFAEIESVMFDKSHNLVIPWMLGKLSSKDVCNFIGDKIGIESELLHYELEKSCREMQFVNDEVITLLKKIKGNGYKLIIATDNMDTFSNFTYPEIKKYNVFDGYLNSFDIKSFKYDCVDNSLPFFDHYLQKNGLTYKDVVLIDDSIDKKGNYLRLGFKIININGDFSLNEALRLYV